MEQEGVRLGAPWSRGVLVTTVVVSLLLLLFPVVLHFVMADEPVGRLGIQTMVLLLLAGMAIFSVQGYEVREGALGIVRPLWTTWIELEGLESVEWVPGVMGWTTLRLWGSGGVFGFFGVFYSGRLGGRFRAWVTDPERSVVLKMKGQVLVVSPEDPERLVALLRRGLAGRG